MEPSSHTTNPRTQMFKSILNQLAENLDNLNLTDKGRYIPEDLIDEKKPIKGGLRFLNTSEYQTVVINQVNNLGFSYSRVQSQYFTKSIVSRVEYLIYDETCFALYDDIGEICLDGNKRFSDFSL